MREQCALLVDDSHQDQWLIRRALESGGWPVRLAMATTGDEAVAYLSGVGVYADRGAYPLPAVVLLDIKMPRQSGFEVLQWLRREGGKLKKVPVVMLSSSDQARDIQQAYEQGANGYVVKPGGQEEMKRAMDHICSYWLDENRPPNPTCSGIL